MNLIQRVACFAGAVCLIFPGVITDVIGVALTAAVWFWQKQQQKQTRMQHA